MKEFIIGSFILVFIYLIISKATNVTKVLKISTDYIAGGINSLYNRQ